MLTASEELGLPPEVVKRTMLPRVKLRHMKLHLARLDAADTPGAIVECGVYRGGSAAALGLFSPKRDLWLYDSFAGLPQPTEKDIGTRSLSAPRQGERDVAKLVRAPGAPLAPIGHCAAPWAEVDAFLWEQLGQGQRFINFVRGWFQDTVAGEGPDEIAFLHIDGDWYESTKVCLEAFWPRVVPGGTVAVDDYNWWPGCRKAVDEFFAGLSRETPGQRLLQSHAAIGTGRYMVKR